MKQKFSINAKEDEKGIAGQARNDRSFRMKTSQKLMLGLFAVIFVLQLVCVILLGCTIN
jgi:hypothetical protein